MKTTTIPNSAHDPCCSAHGEPMTCEKYRRTHFVEVRPCCSEDAERLKAEDAPIPELVQALGSAVIDAGLEGTHAGARRCPEDVPRGGGVRCDRYADHDGEHGWGSGPFTRSRGLDALIPTGARQGDYRLREPETVAEALEDVHRRYCGAHVNLKPTAGHDPVCRLLATHVGNLEAALEAGRKREPVAPAGSDGDRDGVTFTPEFDRDRLNRQAGDVYDTLAGKYSPAHKGTWWTLRELAEFTGHPEASVSARIRDLRKPRFGGLTIERRRRGEGRGTWEYRLVPPCPRDHAGPCFSDPRLCAKILTDARAAEVTP